LSTKLDKLNKILGSPFEQLEALRLALKHRSSGARNNERLEFLGDSILGFIITESLYKRFPTAKEGQLSRMRARLVKRETLAAVAREFSLGEYLEMGTGELKSGGHNRDSILSDALEAIIGAIYLERGLEVTRLQLESWFNSRLAKLSPDDIQKDAKTRLQEFLQARGSGLPIYHIISTEGEAHDQIFHVECEVSMLHHPVAGSAHSKKHAEQVAANATMILLEKQD